MSVSEIIQNFSQKKLKPLYFLHGVESYFIDQIVDYAEEHLLSEGEKSFNQTILYGKDIDFSTIVNAAKRYPMMSDYQLIIIKEAQDLKWGKESSGKGQDPFEAYIENPLESTILIFAYKNGKIDSRKKIFKSFEKKGVVFESKEVRDYEIDKWISAYVSNKKYQIDANASHLLGEYLGTNLSKIVNELDKLMLNIPVNSSINTDLIQKYVGISKEYNVFEFQKALMSRNVLKANQISIYFANSPKENPFPRIVENLYGFFSKVLKYHLLEDKKQATAVLGVNAHFIRDYEIAARNYSLGKIYQNISFLREYDLKSKGVNATSNYSNLDMWKEFTFKLIH